MQLVIGGLVRPLRARIPPNKSILVTAKVNQAYYQASGPPEIAHSKQVTSWALFEGSLPRGSLGGLGGRVDIGPGRTNHARGV